MYRCFHVLHSRELLTTSLGIIIKLIFHGDANEDRHTFGGVGNILSHYTFIDWPGVCRFPQKLFCVYFFFAFFLAECFSDTSLAFRLDNDESRFSLTQWKFRSFILGGKGILMNRNESLTNDRLSSFDVSILRVWGRRKKAISGEVSKIEFLSFSENLYLDGFLFGLTLNARGGLKRDVEFIAKPSTGKENSETKLSLWKVKDISELISMIRARAPHAFAS